MQIGDHCFFGRSTRVHAIKYTLLPENMVQPNRGLASAILTRDRNDNSANIYDELS
jgi:hypothetical protein